MGGRGKRRWRFGERKNQEGKNIGGMGMALACGLGWRKGRCREQVENREGKGLVIGTVGKSVQNRTICGMFREVTIVRLMPYGCFTRVWLDLVGELFIIFYFFIDYLSYMKSSSDSR